MDPAKLPEATRAWLGNGVAIAGRDALAPALAFSLALALVRGAQAPPYSTTTPRQATHKSKG